MYCKKCGNIVGSDSKRCHICGYPPERIPELSAALSVLIPGLGQIYNFDITKGIVLLIIGIIIILLIMSLTKYNTAELDHIKRLMYSIYIFYAVFCTFDAYKDAIYKNG